MTDPCWLKALVKACLHTYHLGLHTLTEKSIVMHFLWRWGNYSADVWPLWERVFVEGRDEDERFAQNISPLLQRAATEGEAEDRVFALFLLGGLATSEAKVC